MAPQKSAFTSPIIKSVLSQTVTPLKISQTPKVTESVSSISSKCFGGAGAFSSFGSIFCGVMGNVPAVVTLLGVSVVCLGIAAVCKKFSQSDV